MQSNLPNATLTQQCFYHGRLTAEHACHCFVKPYSLSLPISQNASGTPASVHESRERRQYPRKLALTKSLVHLLREWLSLKCEQQLNRFPNMLLGKQWSQETQEKEGKLLSKTHNVHQRFEDMHVTWHCAISRTTQINKSIEK